MAEYIEREALPQKKERGFFLDDYFNAGWNACLNNIEAIPAADVQPVRHGRWIDTDNYYMRWKCSECGNHTRDARPPYCPNCGANMDGGETDD